MISALFTTNMQTSDCFAIIQPECTEINQRKLLVKNNRKKKTTANIRSFKEQRRDAIYPQVALENRGDRSKKSCVQTS